MKIVIDARMLNQSSGIGRYLSKLLPRLERLDTENNYVVLLQRQNFDLYAPQNPNFIKQVANYRHFSLREQLQFCVFLYRLRADLVHFPNINHPIFYLKPKIVNIMDLTLVDFKNIRGSILVYWLKYWSFRVVVWLAAHRANHIITISNYVRDTILKRYRTPKTKISTIYPAVDSSTVKSEPYQLMRGKQFLLYVGAAYPFKNLALLIEAFRMLESKQPQLHLVLVGKKDWFYQHLEQQTKTGSNPNILFTGFVPDNQLRWLYQNASAYVFPSLSEGFGLPGLEAMAADLPVIAARSNCLPEIYGDAALYFDPYNSRDLADKINQLLENQQLRQQLINKGLNQIKNFSWDTMAEQTLTLYKKVLAL